MKTYKPCKVKRYIKIEKLTFRKYHIADLHLLIQILYPSRRTTNPEVGIIEIIQFTTYQKQLIKDTVHSLTIINELYRDKDKYGVLYSTKEDIYNAIHLLQNELNIPHQSYLLAPNLRWFYKELQQYYQDTFFTSKEVQLKLEKAKTTVYEHLTELVDKELIEIIGKKAHAFVYQLKD